MIRRHSLVWLKRTPAADAAAAWFAAGHPFIVARTRPGEELSLGYCRPPSGPGHPPSRHALAAALGDLRTTERPPLLGDVTSALGLPALPPVSAEIRLIGSRLWQVLTGEPYGRPGSDLDLVVDLPNGSASDSAVAELTRLQTLLVPRLDAELSFPGHGEVHWQEWRSGVPRVLVKSLQGVALRDRAELLAP